MKMNSFIHGPRDARQRGVEVDGGPAAQSPGARRGADGPGARCAIDFALDAESLWRVAGRVRGARIECRQGRLWLTQAGAIGDVVLQPGESFAAEGDGAIVVQSVAASVADRIARGTMTVASAVARLEIRRRNKPGAAARVRVRLAGGDDGSAGEQMAFVVLWLSGMFGVAYCLKTALWLM